MGLVVMWEWVKTNEDNGMDSKYFISSLVLP